MRRQKGHNTENKTLAHSFFPCGSLSAAETQPNQFFWHLLKICEDGSTRRKLVQQRESLRHQSLTKALKEHQDRSFRPVTVYQNFDKLSGAWL